jgi:inhibitor of KinA
MQTTAGVESFLNIYALNEQSVTIEFGSVINENVFQKVTSFNNLVNQNPFPGFYTTVPAYATLTVFFDALQVIQSDLPGADCFEKVSGYLAGLKGKQNTAITQSATITIPVCYGEDFGPDINAVAGLHNITAQEVINLHSSAVYKVYMIGFVPGFAYLGGMPDLLETPRKSTPRGAVPAGSVGIAGKQTGIYPLETPGGWQIIGRTPLQMFNAARPQPALLKAGDQVVFKPINRQGFNRLTAK